MEEFPFNQYLFVAAVFILVTLRAFGPQIFSAKRGRRRLPSVRFRAIERKYKIPLEKHFRYYQYLNAENKSRFERRVQAFIDANQFIPRSYTHVTDEMKALIAASAIQLTFGYHHLNFEHFSKILIYQDDYYSRITRKYHAGEVNIRGLIVLSWRNFVDGYKTHNDGRNLGLHEMAHALRLENSIQNGEYDFIEIEALDEFHELGKEEMKLIARGQTHFFRHYASINMHEFFSVSIENFFERPRLFKEYNNRLYSCLCILLKQDPLKLFPHLNQP